MTINNSDNYRPTQYNVLVGAANNGIANVAPSTSTYILASNGSSANPSFQSTPSLGCCEILISTQNIAGLNAVVFDNTMITSTYKIYKVVLNNFVGPDSTTISLFAFFSTNNGGAYLSTGYNMNFLTNDYNSAGWAANSQTTIIRLAGNLNNTTIISGMEIYFFSLNSANAPCFVGTSNWKAIGAGGSYGVVFGNNSTTSGVNNIKFKRNDSGNWGSGTISLYGIVT